MIAPVNDCQSCENTFWNTPQVNRLISNYNQMAPSKD